MFSYFCLKINIMETVLINFKNGQVKTFDNVRTTIISGNYLVVIYKQSEINADDPEDEAYLLTINEIFDLNTVLNYTVKTKTKKYPQEQ
jgi:hypothetical protein